MFVVVNNFVLFLNQFVFRYIFKASNTIML